MAKHIVKCLICGNPFDANIEPFIKVNSRRYAHLECYENAEAQRSQEDKDKESLEKYIMKLFNEDYVNARIRKQINEFMSKYNYTYSGIQRSLEYFYEVKGNNINKANGGIGIVPFVYQDAYNYYYSLWLAKQRNVNKDLREYYTPKVVEVKIPVPERKIKKRKLFTFLDEEEVIDNEQ